jgi:protein transport protein SEC24
MRTSTDLEFGVIDSDKAVTALIKHESKLDETLDAHFQCAILYTSTSGERRVRIHNLAVPVSNVMGDVFRYADMDATLTCVCKQGK